MRKMSEVIGSNRWKVSFVGRKPLDLQPLVRIPNEVRVAVGGGVHGWDGHPLQVEISADGRVLWLGSLNVTSGGELYIPKKVRTVLSRETKLTFSLGPRSGRVPQSPPT
jgi:hypothetical protein